MKHWTKSSADGYFQAVQQFFNIHIFIPVWYT